MPLFDMLNDVKVVTLLEGTDLVATDTASAWLDTAGYTSCMIIITIGALTGVDGSNYVTPKLQGGVTTVGADAVDLTSSNGLLGTFTKIDAAAEDSVSQVGGYVGATYRYVRGYVDYTGSGITAGIVSMIGLLSRARSLPVGAPVAGTAAT